jgi:transketolase
MELPVLWVWTHDSVGLGEDGPTHQPVETYAALRAIPKLWFVRPADANETSYAWKVALERRDGPVALSLSRQKVPTLDRSELAPASGLEKGAYTLWESGATPDLILISTGAEVGLALEAGRKIAAENGTDVRVVSMPCWELFEAQPSEYRDEVLPPEVKARLAIEPGVALGWKQWVGDRGDSISLDRFGASAPGNEVLERLGYNVDNVVARATALLERVA